MAPPTTERRPLSRPAGHEKLPGLRVQGFSLHLNATAQEPSKNLNSAAMVDIGHHMLLDDGPFAVHIFVPQTQAP